MLRHYLLVAVRTLRRQKGYAFLNVAGLAVGLACAVLLSGYVRLERSFDRFHANAGRIYRVVQQQPGNVFMGTDRFAVTQAPLGRVLVEEAPEVEAAATLGESGDYLLTTERGRFVEQGLYADAGFFRVFSFPLRRGNPETALRAPRAIVLTEALARKLFGDADPVGQTVLLSGSLIPHQVTGVVADPPATSHLTFAYLLPLASNPAFTRNADAWDDSSWYTYLVLEPNASPAALERRMAELHRRHRAWEGPAPMPRLSLQPLADIHLRSRFNSDIARTGDVRLVYLFSAIAVVILLLAGVNYANLAVARSTQRAREVGLRKVVGASRGQIIAQHLSESVLTALLALGLGLVLARLALPAFSAWLERDLGPVASGGPLALGPLVGLAVVLGLVAGLYPAFVLTAMRPVRVLKGREALPAGRVRLRSVLVVGQYASAIVLMTGSLVIYRQMAFVQNRPLGFDRAHVLTLHSHDLDVQREVSAFKERVGRLPGVVGVTASSELPTNVTSSTRVSVWEGHPEGSGGEVQMYRLPVDADFLDVYGMRIVAGRGFSADFPADTAGAAILNETAVRQLGWTTETAVGKTVEQDGSVRVVGVVRDFHLHAMHQPIEPLMLQLTTGWINRIAVRVRPERLPETLASIEQAWSADSEYPFAYAFLDEDFDLLYRADRKLGEAVGVFTVVVLFIACLGLFGLAAYTAERRTKEIGVRKVLGASVAGIVALLSKDFLGLVGVALLVATPVAYLAMSRWLEGFAYHVTLGPGVFVLAGALALCVALATVASQALRAASTDPVKALRSD